MKNWRKTLADILRDLGGKAHLSEIYSEIETRGSELGTEWKAVARGNLERNSSDCDAWDKKYDIFELKQKGSGNWFLKTNIFREQILDPNTNFFIFTTGKKEHRDEDFKIYTWNKHRYNKVKPGDLFIYRISGNTSPNNQFYFFGAGQVNAIYPTKKDSPQYKEEGDVSAEISNPISFNNRVVQLDSKPGDLDFNKGNWSNTFGQYGMDQIPLSRFLFLLNRGTGQKYSSDTEENKVGISAHNKEINKDYSVDDSECVSQKSRGKWQRIFREQIILPNYNNICAITGIQTTSLLTAAHIIRWADDKDKRIDPQNGICLSKLVDKCFEDNLIYIDDDFNVRLSERIKEDKSLFEELKKYEGQKIFLPINKNFRPKKEYLKIHRERK